MSNNKLSATERARKIIGDIILQQRCSVADAKKIAKMQVRFLLKELDDHCQGWLTADIESYWGFVIYAIDKVSDTEEWRLY